MLSGIDVSYWQSTTPPLTGLSFAFARATYGDAPDSRFVMHLTNFKAAGLVTGAYHYGRSAKYASIASQVKTFLATAQGADLLCLDLEGDGSYTAMTDAEAAQFITAVHATGKHIGLYHSGSGYPTGLGQDFRWFAQWGTTAPSLGWQFWQYSGTDLDRDYFNGSLDQLKSLVGVDMFAVVTLTEYPEAAPGRQWTVNAGVTINGYDPAKPNVIVRTQTFTTTSLAHADGEASITWYGTSTPPVPRGFPFLHVSDGAFAGLYIVEALVSVAPPSVLVPKTMTVSGTNLSFTPPA